MLPITSNRDPLFRPKTPIHSPFIAFFLSSCTHSRRQISLEFINNNVAAPALADDRPSRLCSTAVVSPRSYTPTTALQNCLSITLWRHVATGRRRLFNKASTQLISCRHETRWTATALQPAQWHYVVATVWLADKRFLVSGLGLVIYLGRRGPLNGLVQLLPMSPWECKSSPVA